MFEEGQKLKALHGADKVFDFSLGNPDIEPPAAFRETLLRLASSTAKGSHAYMSNAGYSKVREAVALRASRDQGLAIPSSHITMSVGAAGGLNVVLKTILDPGDEVVVVRPYFAEYLFYVQNHGGTFVPVPSGPGFTLDPEAIGAALTEKTACVILNSPNNPTGRIYTKPELEAVAQVLKAHGKRTGRLPYIVADEPYRSIVYGGTLVPSIMEVYDETIVVSSWSKSLSLPGERIGYIALSPRASEAKEVLDGLAFSTRVLGYVNAPALMQRVVASLLDEVSDVESYARRGRLLAEGLKAAGYEFPEPQGAFYIFAKVPELPGSPPDAGLDVAFAMHLKAYRVLAVPGVGFGCPGWFRLSFCVSESTIRGAIPLFAQARRSWIEGVRA